LLPNPLLPESITVQMTGHFLRADFARSFGRRFWQKLLVPNGISTNISIRETKVIGLAGGGAEQFRPPVIEFVDAGGALIPVRLTTFDTSVAFGAGSLDDLAAAFLGVGKSRELADDDKARMKSVFLANPRRAYQYAATDVVLTLLLAERMAGLHTEIYRSLGFDATEVPRCHATPGLRLSTLLLQDVARRAVEKVDPKTPNSRQDSGPSLQQVKDLFAEGTADTISAVSRYGRQTGQTHGGLLYSRTPEVLFHSASGQFRDVDLSSCYPSILRKLRLYVGRPIVLEPGNDALTLKEAVAILDREAAGWDAWFIRITGPISAAPNGLVPSTDDALTHANYKRRAARRRRQAIEKDAERRGRSAGGKEYTTLYTNEVLSGTIVWATWKLIQAMPPKLRKEYENLRVETVVFYPRSFVADSWAELEALRKKLATGMDLDWSQRLDLANRAQMTFDDLDDKYAVLSYQIGDLAGHLVQLRQEASRAGRGAGMDRALKLTANTLYGALCSPHLPSQNVVAAQVVTGTARALAFAMAQSLNAINVITDGVIYRRDQIPAGTFASCLRAHPTYPIERAEAGVRFLDPAAVPDAPERFTHWYAAHVMQFFSVRGKDYEFLFGLHGLEHKRLPRTDRVGFDGLIADGAANYAKLLTSDSKTWEVVDFKARSFRSADKAVLATWLLAVCSTDQYTEPPPPTESYQLLTYHDALAVCRGALQRVARAVLPLGMARPKLQTYKIIKRSQFVFCTARQENRIDREWEKLVEATGCGPEILALRKTYRGSVSAVASAIHGLIRAGKDRLRSLNTQRLNTGALVAGTANAEKVQARRMELAREFLCSLDTSNLSESALATGISLDQSELTRMAL
jgi:hypothetical protein